MEEKIELVQKVIREMDTDELFEIVKESGIVNDKEAFEKLLVLYFLVAA
jgi:hypothetical protein